MNRLAWTHHLSAIFMVDGDGACVIPGQDASGDTRAFKDQFIYRLEAGERSLQSLAESIFLDEPHAPLRSDTQPCNEMLHRALGGVPGRAVFGLPPAAVSLKREAKAARAVKAAPAVKAARAVKGALKNLTGHHPRNPGNAGQAGPSEPEVAEPIALLELTAKRRAEVMYCAFYATETSTSWATRQLQCATKNMEAWLLEAAGQNPSDPAAQHALRQRLELPATLLPLGPDWDRTCLSSPSLAVDEVVQNPIFQSAAAISHAAACDMEDELLARAVEASNQSYHQNEAPLARSPRFAPCPVPHPDLAGSMLSESQRITLTNAERAAQEQVVLAEQLLAAFEPESVPAADPQVDPASAPVTPNPVPRPLVQSPATVMSPLAIISLFAPPDQTESLRRMLSTARVPARLSEVHSAHHAWRLDTLLEAVPNVALDAPGLSDGARTLAATMLQLRAWVETDMDMQAVSNATGLQLHVHDRATQKVFAPAGHDTALASVHVIRASDHYQAAIEENGKTKIIDKFSRGDCFYGSVAVACNYRRLREMVDAHQTEDLGIVLALLGSEYPEHPEVNTIDEAFETFTDLALTELRQRSAAALIALHLNQSEADRAEMDMIAQALGEGDLPTIKEQQKAAKDTAHSLYGQAPFAAFKYACEAMVHSYKLLDTFYAGDDASTPSGERAALLHDCVQLERVATDSIRHVDAGKRQSVRAEMAGLYFGRALPGVVQKIFDGHL